MRCNACHDVSGVDIEYLEGIAQNGTKQLGAADPDRKTSPVAWEADDDTEALREAVPEEAVCFFNDLAYDHGTVISSGSVLLRCDHGVWLPSSQTDDAEP